MPGTITLTGNKIDTLCGYAYPCAHACCAFAHVDVNGKPFEAKGLADQMRTA